MATSISSSLPVASGALGGVVTPLVVAAMFLPSLGWLAPMKYTIAGAGFVARPSWRYAFGAAAITLVSVAIWPWWPLQWFHELHDVAGKYYHVPVVAWPGFFVLLALARWRRPEARLLVAMALVPQTMAFYDQLPLLLVARDYRQALIMALASWIPPGVVFLLHRTLAADRATLFAWNAPVIVLCYYLPLLVVVLRRPNHAEHVDSSLRSAVPEANRQTRKSLAEVAVVRPVS